MGYLRKNPTKFYEFSKEPKGKVFKCLFQTPAVMIRLNVFRRLMHDEKAPLTKKINLNWIRDGV